MAGAELPLAGTPVVVCRAASDAQSLIERLRGLGAEPIAVPLHEHVPPTDGGAALLAAVAELDRFAWLVATSANGVRALIGAGAGPVPSQLRVAAVGPATEAAFQRAGIAVELVPERATAEDLAAALPEAMSGEVVLAPLNEAADQTLQTGLERRGYRVERVDAYRMAEPPPSPGDAEAVADAGAVLFTAPSLVDRYCDRFGVAAVPPVVVCIGPRTASRARSRGLGGIVEAPSSTEDGLIETLVATLGPTARPRADGSSPPDGAAAGSRGSPAVPDPRTADR